MNCPVCKKHAKIMSNSNKSYQCSKKHFKYYDLHDYDNSGFYIRYDDFIMNYFEKSNLLEISNHKNDSFNKELIIENLSPEAAISMLDKLFVFM